MRKSKNRKIAETIERTELGAEKIWASGTTLPWGDICQVPADAGTGESQFSSVAQSCPTLCDPMNRSARPPCPSPSPGVHTDSRPSSP